MSDLLAKHEFYMRKAIDLASRAWGQTHPNPMVGALIVENGKTVAEGWHSRAGDRHAEVVALDNLGRKPNKGAILYVTLEPCSTCGRTAACTDKIIDSGISFVVIGVKDPNPLHAGKGIDRLRQAGIRVRSGVLAEKCSDLNLIFNHWITNLTPLFAAKMALTLDGKFTAASGHSQWITGNLARQDVMLWRRYFPAIAVGANTIMLDDPSLTAREGNSIWCPLRFIFDRNLITLGAKTLPRVYSDAYMDRTIVLCSESAAIGVSIPSGISLWILPENEGHLDWDSFRLRCVQEEICGVFIETGPKLATAVVENSLVDYLFIYQAPKLMSDASSPGLGTFRKSQSIDAVFTLNKRKFSILGDDFLTRGFLI